MNFADKIRAMAGSTKNEAQTPPTGAAELVLDSAQVIDAPSPIEPGENASKQNAPRRKAHKKAGTPRGSTSTHTGTKTGREPAPPPADSADHNGPVIIDAEFSPVNEESEAPAASRLSNQIIQSSHTCGLGRLLSGDSLPRSYLPLHEIREYGELNSVIQQGKVRLADMNGIPVVELTPTALQLMDMQIMASGEEVMRRIESHQQEIERLRQEIARDMPEAQRIAEKRAAIRLALQDMNV